MPVTNVELPEEVAEYIAELESTNDELNKALTEHLEAIDEEPSSTEQVLSELLEKSEDDQTREALSKAIDDLEIAKADAQEAREIAKAEQGLRLDREFISKAASFESLPGVTPQSFGPILKSASESMSADQFDQLVTVLSAANQAVNEGSLFAELGKTGEVLTGETELEKAAAQIMVSDNVDKFTAIAKAVEANPALYESHRKDV